MTELPIGDQPRGQTVLKIEFLNHASVVISTGDVRLLIDPWFSGTCFASGWGLRFRNNDAMERAKTATHLWISHFHSDHFHLPTLRALLEVNPDIVVLGNRSRNFQLDDAMRKIGFAKVVSLGERVKFCLGEDITVTRYPATGIDNMLVFDSPGGRVLNYNDCNLPSFTRRRLARRIGPIDVLMTNFNHAGKLLVGTLDPGKIKERLRQSFESNYSHFDVRHVFPFASYHYYRSPFSQDQNDSMLMGGELVGTDPKILPVRIGDTVSFDSSSGEPSVDHTMHVEANELSQTSYNETFDLDVLKRDAAAYLATLRRRYGAFVRFLPPLRIDITDLDYPAVLHPSRGLEEASIDLKTGQLGKAHIVTKSQPLHYWFTSLYGTDTFVVGAHFGIASGNQVPLKWQIVFGMLVDNRLDLRSLLGMCFSVSGLKFLANRREEILGILLERKVHADYHD